MAASKETTEGVMDVDVSFILYNAKGLKAQAVLDGATPSDWEDGGSSLFPYSGFIEVALSLAWDEKHGQESPRSLEFPKSDSYRGKADQNVDEDWYDEDFSLPSAVPGRGEQNPDIHLEASRPSSALNLELVRHFPKLTAGVDIECPEIVPPGTVSGEVNICQRFTATVRVSGTKNERPSAVRAYVTDFYDEAIKNGVVTKNLVSIDALNVFRVPGHSYCELAWNNKAKSKCIARMAYPQLNTTSVAKTYTAKKETASSDNMGFFLLGGIFLLLSLFGVVMYRRRSAHANCAAKSEVPVPNEEKCGMMKDLTEGAEYSCFELSPRPAACTATRWGTEAA